MTVLSALPVRYRVNNIPDALKAVDHWITFAIEGKRKIPLIAGPGYRHAKSNDPSTWTGFAEAFAVAEAHGRYLGFCFTPALGLTFLDLDNVVGAHSTLKSYARTIVDTLDSYTEVSVGGGIHIFVEGRSPRYGTCMDVGGKVELFPGDGARFCLITGDTRPGMGSLHGVIEARERELATLFPARAPQPATANGASPEIATLTEAEINAIVAALSPHWADGQRHNLAMAIGGICAKNSVNEAQALAIVHALAANDEDEEDRARAVQDSYRKHRGGANLRGYQSLLDLVPEEALHRIDEIMQRVWESTLPRLHFKDPAESVPDPALPEPPPKRFVWTVSELLAETFPPIRPLVGGILDRGSATSLFGAGGAGKSWLSLSLGLSIATGTPWIDRFPATAGRVLIIDQEGRPDRVQARLLRLCQPDAIPAETPLIYARPSGWRVDTPEGYRRIQALIAEHAPDLVIVDSGTRFHQADENKSQEMALVAQHFAELTTDQGIALLIVDHANKVTTSDDPRARLRGSTDKFNALDGALFVERRVGEQTLNVTPVKSRYDVELVPFSIVFDHADGRTRLTYQEGAESAATPEDALAAIVRLSADDPYGATLATIGLSLFSSPQVTSAQRDHRTRKVVGILEQQGRVTRVDVPRQAVRGGRKTAYQVKEQR